MPFLSGRDAHVDASSVDAKFGIRVVQCCAGVLMKKISASLRLLVVHRKRKWLNEIMNLEWTFNNAAGKNQLNIYFGKWNNNSNAEEKKATQEC